MPPGCSGPWRESRFISDIAYPPLHLQQHAAELTFAPDPTGDGFVDSPAPIPELEWKFACILQPAEEEDIPAAVDDADGKSTSLMTFDEFVVHKCREFHRHGLDVQVVERSETSQHKVVILLRCQDQKLEAEHRARLLRHWKTMGYGEGPLLEQVDSHLEMQPIGECTSSLRACPCVPSALP